MSRFDEEPDGDPHGECALEIASLQSENARLRGELAIQSNANVGLMEELAEAKRELETIRANAGRAE